MDIFSSKYIWLKECTAFERYIPVSLREGFPCIFINKIMFCNCLKYILFINILVNFWSKDFLPSFLYQFIQ